MAKKAAKKPAKQALAKKAAKKPVKKAVAKKAAQKPSKARSPKKRAAPRAKPRTAVRAKAAAFTGASGAVSSAWGRLRWQEEARGRLVFDPYLPGDFIHRVSLVADFGVPVVSAKVALGEAEFGPKVEGSCVVFRFQPPAGKLKESLVIEANLGEGDSVPVVYPGP